MWISDLQALLLTFSGGAALGAVFFLGLRWTVVRVLHSRSPLAWQLGSALVRSIVVLAGIWLLGAGHWERMVVALAGFAVARVLLVRAASGPEHAHGKEASDAPQP